MSYNKGDEFISSKRNRYTLAEDAKKLSNGAVAAKMTNGRFIIMKGAPASYMKTLRRDTARRPTDKAAAQKAFDAYYKTTRHYSKGPRKGDRVYKTSSSRKRARTYDINHTKKGMVVDDSRYLGRHGPRLYDYQGVDTGSMVRKVSAKQLANQQRFAAASRARPAAAARRARRNVGAEAAVAATARRDRLAKEAAARKKNYSGQWAGSGQENQEGGQEHQEGGQEHQEGGFWW